MRVFVGYTGYNLVLLGHAPLGALPLAEIKDGGGTERRSILEHNLWDAEERIIISKEFESSEYHWSLC